MTALPLDFINHIKQLLPEDEWDSFFDSYNKPALHGLRINPLKCTDTDFMTKLNIAQDKVSWCNNGFYYPQEARPGKSPYHEAGVYYIQEPSAMITGELAQVKPGEYILDMCAAPGGKSSQIAGYMNGEGLLVSNEIIPNRASILSQNIERMGIRNTVVTNHSPEELTHFFPYFFDKIVVDAPCSGEGMFRKNPEAINEWSLENIDICATRQEHILDMAVQMLVPGGTIIYSTCTFSKEENEDMVRKFVQKYPDFDLVYSEKIWPHREKGEGHFAAVFKDTTPYSRPEPARSKLKSIDKNLLRIYTEFVESVLTDKKWSSNEYTQRLQLFGDNLYLLPEGITSTKGIKILRAGLHLGTFKKNRFEPSHSLALALKSEDAQNVIYIDSEEAAGYLKGNTLTCENQKGWCLVCVDNYSVGWGKASNGVCKNHFPKGLRR